ncbi:hypothetical protein ACT6QG_11800 [Xanthobacter sp. TB0136]|uniref:hypothetical protein n=1 Tax=Xanthobacter sp. TB0136 TaxID=3459177 RepID=UPI00403966CE
MLPVNIRPLMASRHSRKVALPLFALALACPALPALAQEAGKPVAPENACASPPVQAPRYSFAPVDGGVLRLDTENGTVTLCAQDGDAYACKLVPDSRTAYEAQIARLKHDLAAAQAQLDAAAQDLLPQGESAPRAAPVPPSAQPPSAEPPANRQEMDAAFDYADKVLRWLRNALKDAPPPPSGEESL